MSCPDAPAHILPDVLAPDLKIVFVGTAAGDESARRGAYYAHPGNAFWRTLHAVGLTPRLLLPHEFKCLPDFGLGLTDIAKLRCGSDASLAASDFDIPGLRAKIERFAPRAVGFNGKKAASLFVGVPTSRIVYGKQPQTPGLTSLWALPSTSGGARRFWDVEQWHMLARAVR